MEPGVILLHPVIAPRVRTDVTLRSARTARADDTARTAAAARVAAAGAGPDGALRCPHGVDHPSWCSVCRLHWEARLRHPSWRGGWHPTAGGHWALTAPVAAVGRRCEDGAVKTALW